MESIIVNTVSANAHKGRSAIDWVVEKIGQESKVSVCRTCTIYSSVGCVRSIGRKLPIHFLIVYLQNISGLLDKITDEVQELRDTVADSVITTAKSSIEDLRKNLADLSLADMGKDISSIQVQCSRAVGPRTILSAEEAISFANIQQAVPLTSSHTANINIEK